MPYVYFLFILYNVFDGQDRHVITCVFQHQIFGLVKRFPEWEQQNVLKPRWSPRS
jgi:hypothetical protein